MSNDNINDIINDAHNLAKHCEGVPAQMLKLGIEGLASRLEKLYGALGDRALPADEACERFGKFLSIPELGIQFRRHKSANMTKLIATWRDDFNDHVYEISVQRDGDSPNCGWRATATNDGHVVFSLTVKDRSLCEHFALSAMKRYLKRGHRKTYRTLRKAAAANPVNPVNPV
jgi:hypothetical protein